MEMAMRILLLLLGTYAAAVAHARRSPKLSVVASVVGAVRIAALQHFNNVWTP